MHEANLKHMVNQDRVAQGQLGVAQGQLGVAQGNLALNQRAQKLDQQNKLEQLYAANIQSMGEVSKMSASSAEGTKMIVDEIGKMTDPAAKRQAFQAFNEMKLKNPNMLSADAMTSLMGIYQRWWRGDGTIRDEVTDTAGSLAGSPGSALQSRTIEGKAMALQNQGDRLRSQMKVNESELYGNLRGEKSATKPAAETQTTPVAAPAQPVVDNVSRLRAEAVAEQRRKDSVINEYKLKADAAASGGAPGNRWELAQTARVKDVADNFDSTLNMLRPGASRADIQKALDWIDNKEEAGVLTRAQQKQVREARREAGL
jgi:hypothetical protein